MSKYFTLNDRYVIETMLKDGKSPKQIADRLGRHFTTVYKEIKKGTVRLLNSDLTFRMEYCADTAQRVTDERQTNKGRDLKIGNDYALAAYIEHLIGDLHYSPYAAVCDIRKQKRFSTDICKTTLYRYIDMGLFLNISNKDLYIKRNKRKKKHDKVVKRSRKQKGKSIEQRPKSIRSRNTYGHWEMDTVYSGRRDKTCLLVLTERMTREEYLLKMPDRTAKSTVAALDNLEIALGRDAFRIRFKSITCDNGSEFSDYKSIMRSCTVPGAVRTHLFYCHPYTSSERGSNENANKLIRHYIAKGEAIGRYSDEQIQDIQDWINNYPRALFGGMSTNEYKSALGIE